LIRSSHRLRTYAVAGLLVLLSALAVAIIGHNGSDPPAAGGTFVPAAAPRICGGPLLRSPFTYDGKAGHYASGKAGLPTYGQPKSDFPQDHAGVVIPAGKRDYASYQLHQDTVYYLVPGEHIGGFQADTNDAFVGGFAKKTKTTLTGNYSGQHWGIDSNSTDGNQTGVTIEYLTIEKYQPVDNAAAINQDGNTGWIVRYNTIKLNVPGAGVIVAANGVLRDNCMTLNGQYGFQSTRTNSWGKDSLTGGPYNVTVVGNEVSYNDTCDFEGKLTNHAIGWSNYNPVPPKYRNSLCGTVTPDGDEGGFKLWETNGVTIKENYIHNNWGPGAWADTDNANTTYDANSFVDNDDEAIIEEISYNFSIKYNYLANNGWAGGLSNAGFPNPAVFVSGSGSDRYFSGVPGCRETSCRDQFSYSGQSAISHNTLVNNSGSVFLWQDSNRFCTDGYDHVCALVSGGAAGPFSMSGCRANLARASISTTTFTGNRTGQPPRDWWDGCLWRTENVAVTHNVIDFNPAKVKDCNHRDWPACGAGGIFSEYSSAVTYKSPGGWAIPTELTFFQGNSWSDNTYHGPSTFYAWNQGNGANPVGWGAWVHAVSRGDKCRSAGERSSGQCTGPFGQDAGSTYSSAPVSAPPPS
jgi:hypothetical protein